MAKVLLFSHPAHWQEYPTIHQNVSDGYPTGAYSIDNLSLANLQELADWMIALPPDLYEHVEQYSRFLERFLAAEHKR